MTFVITRCFNLSGLFLVFVLLAACTGPQKRPAPPVELPSAFSQSGQTSVSDHWWTSFEDPELNELVQRALDDNLSLQASYQRLRQARAVADRQRAELVPSLDANAGVERQESETIDETSFSAGLSASYEVDLWGRVQSLSEAEALRAAASLADYQAAAISLSGEIANTWFQLLEQRSQNALADTQLETNLKVLKVIESRFAMGQSTSADVLRQRQLVSASRERLNSIEGEVTVLRNRLAVLLGQPPGRAKIPESRALPGLPSLPATGVPADLVQRRPDLKQAWRLVQAANQDLAAAISDRFPRFSIEASASSQANAASELFDNWLASLAGNLLVPVIDGGQRRAEVTRSEAALATSLQEYGQSVLTAIREVEDALAREQQQKQRLQSLEEQERLAEITYQQLRNQYLNGAVSYIEVLTALKDQQDLQRNVLNIRQLLLNTRVALYRALAGSIETPRPSETPAITETNEGSQT